MSILDDVHRRAEGAQAQRHAHRADGARHDHRRRRRHRHGGDRHRRAARRSRAQIQQRRLEHRHGHRRLGRLRARPPGAGRGHDADARTMRRRSGRKCRASGTSRPASTRARRSSPRPPTGTRRCRGPARSSPRIRSWPMQFGSFFSEDDVTARAQGRGARLGRARPAVRCRRRSDRRDRSASRTSRSR